MARKRIKKSSYRFCATCRIVRVKGRDNRYCSPMCVPRSLRAAACQKGRKTYAYRRRAILLKRYLDRLDKRITREELCTVLWEFGKERYCAGYHVGRARGDWLAVKDRDAA
jgi:hypothetical protein